MPARQTLRECPSPSVGAVDDGMRREDAVAVEQVIEQVKQRRTGPWHLDARCHGLAGNDGPAVGVGVIRPEAFPHRKHLVLLQLLDRLIRGFVITQRDRY